MTSGGFIIVLWKQDESRVNQVTKDMLKRWICAEHTMRWTPECVILDYCQASDDLRKAVDYIYNDAEGVLTDVYHGLGRNVSDKILAWCRDNPA